MRITSRRTTVLAGVAVLAAVMTGCGGDASGEEGASGMVTVDGSSTVYPLSDAAAELLGEETGEVDVTVGEAGTGGGFEVFCEGQTDISNASRPIEEDEIAACEEGGVEYTELRVATDALTVVAHPDVEVDCLTTDQLKKVWEPASEGEVTRWNQVDKSFADLPLRLYGPGTDSGTFDYFTEEINGEEGASRTDYESSEDDNVIVQGVAGSEGGLGYFGYSYYEENADQLKALEIDSGSGCVAPSAESAQDGSYAPLARPLYIYVNNASYADNAAVKEYVDFYVENLPTLSEATQFIPLNDEQAAETEDALAGLGG